MRLRNISNKIQTFYIEKSPKLKYFDICLKSSNYKIAPGIAAILEITYKTDTLLDVFDSVIFATSKSKLVLKLASFRNAPQLRCYIYKSNQNFLFKSEQDNYSDEFNAYRSLALNTVIDCGTCLLGDKIKLYLIINNEGSTGTFFIMDEEEWFCKNIVVIF